ncbi:ABC transporter ATP-binding protein [Bacillus alveayuensis]|uniref:ABC transporter ATP-binding protein n=1 Tax=Aeribacillus alveayuensis TaxID=279215 RepID=UPI0005CCE199|nr:ABC transporter ATP-binding protein [Bacillus alveayuensis]
MLNVLSYLKPYKKVMIFAWFLMLIELIVELFHPLLMVKIIDDGILRKDFSIVLKWGSIMVVTSLIAFIAGIVNSFAAAHVGQHYGFDVRNRLFEKIQSFSLANFAQLSAPSLITRITNDVIQIQNTIFMSLRIMLRAPLLVIFGVIMALTVHFKLALIFVVTVPFLVLFLLWMMNKGAALFKTVQQKLDAMNAVMREFLSGMRLIKVYMRGEYEEHRFNKANNEFMDRTIKTVRTVEFTLPVLLFLMNLSIVLILWYGHSEIHTGEATAGEVVAIVNYGTRITTALSIFTFIITAFSRAKASAGRISELLAVNSDLQEIREMTPVFYGKVVFDHVSFQYPNTLAPVLKEISFTAYPKETIAILGATGSGKSSLLQLIPRLYDVTDGQVRVDDIDVRYIKQERLREQIGFVPQETFLFSGTVKDNLAFGKKDVTMDEIVEAAKDAQIHETIMKMPNRYDTVIGQKGVNLSGGQKQRLAIARALIRKPKILLLDDCTSALDLQTESRLLEALKKYECTIFLVTQKITAARQADMIVLLDDGQLVAKGKHEYLLKTSKLYQNIVQSQLRKERIRHGEAAQ